MPQLSGFALRLLGEGKNFATIATLMPDGSPQATVVWIDTDGEHAIFNTAEGRVKTDNLHKDPRVAVMVSNAENPYEQVTIRGRVVRFSVDMRRIKAMTSVGTAGRPGFARDFQRQ